jgi:FlgD Ig-like domain
MEIKIQVLFIFIILLSIKIFSQGNFPLQIGNVWEYKDRYDNSYQYTVKSFYDTIMSNGKTYTYLCGKQDTNIVYYRYYRQSGSKVYKYSTSENKEFLWCDFSKSVNDTVAINYFEKQGDTVIVTMLYNQEIEMFGAKRKQWGFYQKYLNSYLDGIYEVTDSIGVTYEQYTEADFFNYLSGAIINNINYGNITSIKADGLNKINKLILFQNYPNPFNNSTVISIILFSKEDVTVNVFDILGREIRKLFQGSSPNGNVRIMWDGKNDSREDVPSGIYFYSIETNQKIYIGKTVLMR